MSARTFTKLLKVVSSGEGSGINSEEADKEQNILHVYVL